MPQGTTKHACVGQRVQIPAWSDLWMRGARYGTIARVIERPSGSTLAGEIRDGDIFLIRMDHPRVRKLARFRAGDCNFA